MEARVLGPTDGIALPASPPHATLGASNISAAQQPAAGAEASYQAALVGASAIQARLAAELRDKQFSEFRFVRVPASYYDEPLEFRRACLAAPSTHHLCKSIVMENTRAHPSVEGWANPHNSRFYVVVVQYTARLHAEKLKTYIHRLNKGVSKQWFNMRLAPGDLSDELSGYEHNAVTPIGIKTPLPIIVSHAITQLQPGFFFLGAGEVDLKVGLPVAEFVEKYGAMVVDCTYDDGSAEG